MKFVREDYREALRKRNIAIGAFKQALKIEPNNDDVLMNLAIAYNLNKNYNAVTNTLERALDIFPNARAYFYPGSSYAELKHYEKGIQAFSRAIYNYKSNRRRRY